MTKRSFMQLCTGFLSVLLPKIGVAARKLHTIQYQGNTINVKITSGDPDVGQEYSFVFPNWPMSAMGTEATVLSSNSLPKSGQ